MKLHSYTCQSRHGIFYFRYPFENLIQRNQASVRISLKTKCPNKARALARQLGSFCEWLKGTRDINLMQIEEIRELVADYLADVFIERTTAIHENGLSLDLKRSYREAVKHLAIDIAKGNEGAQDLYTADDDFRIRSGISRNEWEEHKDEILPLLRQGSHEQLSKIISAPARESQGLTELHVGRSDSNASQFGVKPPQRAGNLLSVVIDEFIAERKQLDVVGAKHLEAQQADLALLCEIIGEDIDIALFDSERVRDVRSILIQLPKNRNKNRLTKGLPIRKAIAVPRVDKIGGKTINDYLGSYRTFFKWACENSYINTNPFENARVAIKKTPIDERRHAYTATALKQTYDWLVNDGGNNDGYKWASLVGIFTGARLGEITQLEITDIIEHEGILCFDINSKPKNSNNFKSLKSEAASRIIPVHQNLIDIGFLEYRDRDQARHGEGARLFPKFTYIAKKGYTKNLGRWYNETLMPMLGIKSKSHIFHGLRHTMNTRLLQASVEPTLVEQLLGHEKTGVQQRNYFAHGYTAQQLHEAIHHFKITEGE